MCVQWSWRINWEFLTSDWKVSSKHWRIFGFLKAYFLVKLQVQTGLLDLTRAIIKRAVTGQNYWILLQNNIISVPASANCVEYALTRRPRIKMSHKYFNRGRSTVAKTFCATFLQGVSIALLRKPCNSYDRHAVCPSVCPSVRLSHAGTEWKRRELGSRSLHRRIAQGL